MIAVKWMSGFCALIRLIQAADVFKFDDLLSSQVETAYISVLGFISSQYRQNEDLPDNIPFLETANTYLFDNRYRLVQCDLVMADCD